MTRATLDLPILNYWGGEYFATVPRRSSTTLPHLAHVATFAVHRSTLRSDLDSLARRTGGGSARQSDADRTRSTTPSRCWRCTPSPRGHVRRAVKSAIQIAR